MKELIEIQSKLKAPKSQFNNFGKYNYRSTEDIVEAVKPLLKESNCYLTISDEIVGLDGRFYIKATATITNSEDKTISVNGYAREEDNKKGMDSMQLTGATSSYARKYALNGLFAIDDTKDSDSLNKHGESTPTKKEFIQLWNKKGKPKTDFDKWENLTNEQKREQIKKLQEVS